MKTVKAICTAAILALALSIPTYAGDISSPGITAPAEIPGDMGSPGVASSGNIGSPGFADILMALLSVLP